MKKNTKILILAGGKGVRMESDLPKVLVKLGGKSLIQHLLDSVKESGLDERPTIVVGYKKEAVISELGNTYDYVVQDEQLGTGHAVAMAEKPLAGKYENILILYGDTPWVKASTMKKLLETHLEKDSMLTIGTITLPDFSDWRAVYGKSFSRIVRDSNGKMVKDVQAREATEEEKNILEVNSCCMVFNASWLWDKLKTLNKNNKQGEYYLTDLVALAIATQAPIATVSMDPKEALAANSKDELEILERLAV